MILMLGIFVALMPFLGFPYPYEEGLYVVSGLAIATFSFLLARHKRINRKMSSKKIKTKEEEILMSPKILKKEIVESVPFSEEETLIPETQEEISREDLFGVPSVSDIDGVADKVDEVVLDDKSNNT